MGFNRIKKFKELYLKALLWGSNVSEKPASSFSEFHESQWQRIRYGSLKLRGLWSCNCHLFVGNIVSVVTVCIYSAANKDIYVFPLIFCQCGARFMVTKGFKGFLQSYCVDLVDFGQNFLLFFILQSFTLNLVPKKPIQEAEQVNID